MGATSLSIGLVLAMMGPCLCPAPTKADGHGCCPSQPGFNAAAPSTCCVISTSVPASAAEVAGKFQPSFLAAMAPLAADCGWLPAIAVRLSNDAPLRGASPPLKNLRI